VRVLIDTHTFLWFVSDDPQLSITARAIIEDTANDVLLSIASVWELAIKISLGKLSISAPFATFLPDQLRVNAIDVLGITVEHTSELIGLPFHHRDPFDRLLIAQAMVEGIPLISIDAAFDMYPITRLW
jgi:PIN domain nuclease of toxin-antitoxin system